MHMFWFSFEWVWDMGHIVFMGGLWYALGILGIGMSYVIIKSVKETFYEDSTGHGDNH